jgi:membrane protease subunit HflK
MIWKIPSDNEYNLDVWRKKNKNYKKIIITKISNRIVKSKIKNILSWLKKTVIKFINNVNYYKFLKNSILAIISILFLFFLFSGFYNINKSECGIIIRLGKFNKIVKSGLHWKPIIIDELKRVDIHNTHEITTSGLIITSDENLVNIQVNVEYKITNPNDYLFTVINPQDNLCDVINNLIYNSMSNVNINQVLFKNSIIIRDIKDKVVETIKIYRLGISILDVKIKKIYFSHTMVNSFKKFILAYKYNKQKIKLSKTYSDASVFQANKK